jgi:hypothetical protein
MEGAQRVPYSRKALENLAVALRVDSAAIWFNPTTSRVDLKSTHQDEDHAEWMEDEE